MRRKSKNQPTVPLAAGDFIVCIPSMEYLAIVRPDGWHTDLNALQIQGGSTAACITTTGRFDPFQTMQLAGVLAACYGLSCNTALMLTKGGFACPVCAIGAPVPKSIPAVVINFLGVQRQRHAEASVTV